MMAGDALAQSGVLDLIEGDDDPIDQILSAIFSPGSGIHVIEDSARYVGRVGDGQNHNLAQSAILNGKKLVAVDNPYASISLPEKGVLLTTGVANLPGSNTSKKFGAETASVPQPNEGSSADKSLLSDILQEAEYNSNVLNLNLFEFKFTVAPGVTSIEADFVFASDEFPDQSVTDVFAFIVDGVNYAYFQDGSLVSFVKGDNAENFVDNTNGRFGIEYDGLSNRLHVVGMLRSSASASTVHTLTIAIANTNDQIFDSGVFLGNVHAGYAHPSEAGTHPYPPPPNSPFLPSPSVSLPSPRPGVANSNGAVASNSSAHSDFLLVVALNAPSATNIFTDFGANSCPSQSGLSYAEILATDELAIAIGNDELDAELAIASMLDVVGPEQLVIDLGDEPPAQVVATKSDVAMASPDEQQNASVVDISATVRSATGVRGVDLALVSATLESDASNQVARDHYFSWLGNCDGQRPFVVAAAASIAGAAWTGRRITLRRKGAQR